MFARSATLRLTAAITAVAVALAAVALFLVYQGVSRYSDQRLTELVEADLAGFADLYAQRRIIAVREAMERRGAATPPEEMLLLLQQRDGTRLAGNIDAWPAGLAREEQLQTFAFAPAGSDIDYLGAGRLLPGGFPILVARATTSRDDLLSTLAAGSAAAIVAILFAGLAAGYWLSRRILSRIVRLNDLCIRVEGGDLEARAPASGSDEFAVLARNINAMLERITRLRAAAHDLSNNIAHELRTPLNRILLRIDAMRQGRGMRDAPAAAEIDAVAAQTRETIQVFESLLDIAAAEADTGDAAGFAPVDLGPLAQEIADLYEAVAEHKEVALSCRCEGRADILGDRLLLTRMLANLVDNAVKFTGRGGEVTIAVEPGAATHIVSVRDTGPGIPAGMEERVFERFVRSDSTAAAPGHGLGLALVRAIAIRHGIKIELKSAPTGLNVRLLCPALRSDDR
ncbi:MAG: ATP-binding protein [Flavobacteriaceae bacterium]